MNETDTRNHLIDPALRDQGYVSRNRITLETILTPAPLSPQVLKGPGAKGHEAPTTYRLYK
jgi:type I restriction enzyme R subunit